MDCKAYVKATLNPLVGAEQEYVRFTKEVTLRMEQFAPGEVDDGTYHQCGQHIYSYLCGRIYPKFQNFNKALCHVHACNLTGVTEQEIINMAVAIHMWVTNTMEYSYKSVIQHSGSCIPGGRLSNIYQNSVTFARQKVNIQKQGQVVRQDRLVMRRPHHRARQVGNCCCRG